MVSLCATVFNEADSIGPWLSSLKRQSRRPDEIVICDAGSTDGTLDRLRDWAEEAPEHRLIVVEGATIPVGRNVAIEAAAGPLIAVTDAGTILDQDWLEKLLAPLENDPGLAVSAGFYRPDGRNRFEKILAAVITPRREDMSDDGFPPSSRSVAFRKEWWQRVGGYPEWLRACEDLVFDHQLIDAGARFAFADDAIVSWYPRPTLKDYFGQYSLYARGDGHAHIYLGRHLIRYCAYAAGVVLAVMSRRSRLARLVLAVGFSAHMRRYVRRVRRDRPVDGFWAGLGAYALVPVIVITGDVAKMVSYPRGLLERHRAGGPAGLAEAQFESHRAEKRGASPKPEIPGG